MVNFEHVAIETWTPTAGFRWLVRGETKTLQQLWLSDTGNRAWREIEIQYA